MVVLVLVVLGIIIFLASKREKKEKFENLSAMGEDLLYMQTYCIDVMLAGHDMFNGEDNQQKFMEFKRLIMNSQRTIQIIEEHKMLAQNKKHEPGYQEFSFIINDLRTLKGALTDSHSFSELYPKLEGSLQSFFVDAFVGEVTKEEILQQKDQYIREHQERVGKILSNF
jgi:hypothetical protein